MTLVTGKQYEILIFFERKEFKKLTLFSFTKQKT